MVRIGFHTTQKNLQQRHMAKLFAEDVEAPGVPVYEGSSIPPSVTAPLRSRKMLKFRKASVVQHNCSTKSKLPRTLGKGYTRRKSMGSLKLTYHVSA